MSEPKDLKKIPSWRYKRDNRKGREGMLLSHLCRTQEEVDHYESIGYQDHPPPLPGDTAKEPKPQQVGIDLDGDGTIDVVIKEKVKKKAKKKG
jgi:hypothetical protein